MLLVSLVLFLWLVRRVDRAHPASPVPRRRVLAFLGALAAVLLALQSPIERYDTTLFSVHMLQHILLMFVAAPLIAECFANLECRVTDTRFVRKYDLFVLEVLKAWIDPSQKNPKTLHHKGFGKFAVDGATLRTALADTGLLVTVEDHWVEGGIGSAVLEGLAAGGPIDGRVVTVGVSAMPGSGSPEQLRDWAGISRGRIAARVRELLG